MSTLTTDLATITQTHQRTNTLTEQLQLAKLLSKPTTQIDRIRDVHPKYANLLQKNAELHERQEQIIAEIKPLSEESRRQTIGWVEQQPKPKGKPVVRHAGAVALLDGLLSPQAPEEITPPPPRPSWPGADRLRELGEESESIGEALKLLVPELSKARREYSRLVAAQRGAEYKTVATSVVDAARALGDAVLEHHNWITEQRLAGVAYREFRPLNLERFGNIDEPGSPLLRTILDAVELGHFDAGKIPAWKMPADIALFQGGN